MNKTSPANSRICTIMLGFLNYESSMNYEYAFFSEFKDMQSQFNEYAITNDLMNIQSYPIQGDSTSRLLVPILPIAIRIDRNT